MKPWMVRIIAAAFAVCFSLFVLTPPHSVFASAFSSALEKIDPGDLPLFEDDGDLRHLAEAVSASVSYYERLPAEKIILYGKDGYTAAGIAEGLRRFADFLETRPSDSQLADFIRKNGSVYAHRQDDQAVRVLFTGYYEPALEGRREPCDTFRYPVYGRPDDLAEIRLSRFGIRDEAAASRPLIGRFDGRQVVPYFRRSEIDAGALEGRARPIVWVSDPVALFFLHVQGSGRVVLKDGRSVNLHFEASNGLPYKSIGRYLVDTGRIDADAVSMQSIAEYIRENPDEKTEILHHNPRYIFFSEAGHGVRGCIGVPLTAGRSVALDQKMFPPGSLMFIDTEKPVVNDAGEIDAWVGFSRFALNQDTGSAIRGIRRADFFWGSGAFAETAAGHMQHPGRMYFIAIHPKE